MLTFREIFETLRPFQVKDLSELKVEKTNVFMMVDMIQGILDLNFEEDPLNEIKRELYSDLPYLIQDLFEGPTPTLETFFLSQVCLNKEEVEELFPIYKDLTSDEQRELMSLLDESRVCSLAEVIEEYNEETLEKFLFKVPTLNLYLFLNINDERFELIQ